MITLKEWMELVDYRITEGSDYFLNGETLFALTSWNGEQADGGHSMEIIFDPKTQAVYMVEACDYQRNRAYRLINPDHADIEHDKTAWDDTEWIDLEVDDDFIQKALSIRAGEDYDTGILVTIDLSKDLIYEAAMNAHKQGITLNDYINQALAELVKSVNDGKLPPDTVGKVFHDI